MEQYTKILKASQAPNDRPDDGYRQLIDSIRNNMNTVLLTGVFSKATDLYLFKTDQNNLFDIFLDNLPEGRQHYTCQACRHFVNRFGGLVTITKDGDLIPAMWPDEVPAFFKPAVEAVKNHIKKNAKILSQFYTSKVCLGIPETAEWSHMHASICDQLLSRMLTNDVNKSMAESVEKNKMVWNAIGDYSVDEAKRANQIIQSGVLSNYDVVTGPAKWFYDLLTNLKGAIPAAKTRMVWYAIANANPSYCHIKSSMLGTLLDDIKAGLEVDEIKASFNKKMDPLKYQRPQVAPSTGNIERAEKLFKELGITNASLERRFACLDDIKTFWKPVEEEAATAQETSGSIFGHLKESAKDAKVSKVDFSDPIDKAVMTWTKFKSQILPKAKSMKISLSYGMGSSMSTFLAAVDPECTPILKWDKPDNRNTVSYYLHNGNRILLSNYNISADEFLDVVGICYDPDMWENGENALQSASGVHFIIKEAKDLLAIQHQIQGNAIFPSNLIPQLHEVRSTIEAYSKDSEIVDKEVGYVSAFRLQNSIVYPDNSVKLLVETEDAGIIKCNIDRWD